MITYPLVVSKTRSIKLGDGRATVKRLDFGVDIQKQTVADMLQWLRQGTKEGIAAQVALDNPPATVNVDGSDVKSIDDAQRKTVTTFGTTIAAAAMREVERILSDNIRKSVSKIRPRSTGKLADTRGSWEWVILKGANSRIEQSVPAGGPKTFMPGDRLILRPKPGAIPYAWYVNYWAHRAGQSREGRRGSNAAVMWRAKATKKQKAAGHDGAPIGFMKATAEALSKSSQFKGLRVRAGWTRHGGPSLATRFPYMPCIVIRPALRRLKV